MRLHGALLVSCLAACERVGFSEQRPTGANRSTLMVSAPLVTTCNRILVTLTSRDPDGAVRTSGGDEVKLELFGGQSLGEFTPVVDRRDGTYTALLTGLVAGTPTEVIATVNGEIASEGATVEVDDERYPTDELVFMLDAARATGGACDVPTGLGWTDLLTAAPGTFLGITDPTCTGTSGWCGDGQATEPFRLALDGFNDVVDFGTIATLDTFSVMAWVRPRPGGVTIVTGTGGIPLKPIVAKGAADVEQLDKDTNYVLGLMANGVVGTDLERSPDSLNRPMTGAAAVSFGTWHHIVLTYDQVIRRIYIDGAVDAEQAMNDVPSSAVNSRLVIGAERKVTLEIEGRFQGDVAIVQLYARALSPAEVASTCQSQARRFANATCS